MSTLCRLIGHKPDPNALCYGGIYACQRCGATSPERLPAQGEILSVYWHAFKTWITDRWAKCPNCGWRFLRHNPAVEHEPF